MDAAACLQSSTLKAREAARPRAGRASTRACEIAPAWRVGEALQNAFSIIIDVGGNANPATAGEHPTQGCKKRRLEESTLVVSALGPRVGEKDADFLQATLRQPCQHLMNIGGAYPDVLQAGRGNLEQQLPDARPMDLHCEVIVGRVSAGIEKQILAVAGADLEAERISVAKPVSGSGPCFPGYRKNRQ